MSSGEVGKNLRKVKGGEVKVGEVRVGKVKVVIAFFPLSQPFSMSLEHCQIP